jgi:uncharacterized BrkB/YihY/UPF0761 family membrane protein
MLKILYIVAAWLVREVLIKFIVLAGIYAAMVALMPLVFSSLSVVAGPTAISSAMAALPAGLWYFLDWFRVDFGLPACLSAFAAAFAIRRIPVVG